MTTREPGGPTNQETASNVFKRELEVVKDNWGNDAAVVDASLAKLRETFAEPENESEVNLLHAHAVQWYAVPKDDYRKEAYFLAGSTFHDEPLAIDGKGPEVTGEIVSVTSHEVPGEPGIGWGEVGTSHRSISPYVPGVMLANTQVRGDESINTEDLVFVPLLFINEPDVRTLELVDDNQPRRS